MIATLVMVASLFNHISAISYTDLESCLRNHISKRSALEIVGQNSVNYPNATTINNLYSRQNFDPMVILFPESTADVQLILQATHECAVFLPHKAGFTIQSGGHNYAGYSLSNGIVVNMAKMNQIYWDFPNRKLTVGMGVRWAAIYPRLQGTGLIVVGGGCPDVGIAGFVMGGGWSWMSRSFGLGADNLLEAEIVLADSKVVILNEDTARENEALSDLWFSLRGAGGGNFGIVTRMTIRLRKLRTPTGMNGEMCWRTNRPEAKEAFRLYKDWLLTKPDYFGAPVIMSTMFGDVRACITVVHDGEYNEAADFLRPMYALLPDYVQFEENDLSNFEVVSFINGAAAATNDPGRQYTNAAIIMKENYNDELVEVLFRGLQVAPNPKDTIVFHEGGAAIAAVPSNATAFPYRDLFIVIQVNAIWDSPDDDAKNVLWVDKLMKDIDPFSSGSYVNYMNGKMSNYNQKYYGSNLPRILKTKRYFDPKNFFGFPSGVNTEPVAQVMLEGY
jgi:FAD/FMN-containing dehydrogenase